MGLFIQGKWAAVIAAVVNLILSVILCKAIGLGGIFIATPISRLISTGIIDPYLIYKRTFKRNVLEYFGMFSGYCVVFIVIAVISNFAINCVSIAGWLGVILKAGIVTVIFNGLMISVFFRTKIFKELLQSVNQLVSRKV